MATVAVVNASQSLAYIDKNGAAFKSEPDSSLVLLWGMQTMELKTGLTRLRSSLGALLQEMRSARRVLVHEGGRAFIRRYGWKVVAGVIAYYIVRDVTLYVILPLLLYKTATQT